MRDLAYWLGTCAFICLTIRLFTGLKFFTFLGGFLFMAFSITQSKINEVPDVKNN